MAKARMGARLAAGCLLLWGTAGQAAPPPPAAEMLKFRPKQEGVVCTTPAPAEQDSCKVEPIARQGKTIGWLLRDGKGQVLRRFFDTAGTGKTDAWCYYNNGVEVYREIYGPQGDQYRWLNAGGMKWGVDVNRDGKIDGWRAISAEEVSQEILLAVVKKDFSRIQALMLNENEIKSLELPAAEATRIRDTERKAAAKFQDTVSKLANIGDKIRWLHLETSPPQCLPADTTGMKQDLIKYAQGTLTYINEADNKPADLLVGEIILVGQAWRIIDAPTIGDGTDGGIIRNDGSPNPGNAVVDPILRPLMDELEKLDKTAPGQTGTPEAMAKYNMQRADILERVVEKTTKPEDKEQREMFIRQVADCLGSAVQNSPKDATAYTRLVALKDKYVAEQPGSNLAGHLIFCEMSADYSRKLNEEKPDIGKIQQDWVEKLAKFVQDYPKCEDTPDALIQLGMVNELLGNEDKAKKWYELLVKDYPNSPQAPLAEGSVRRLDLVGKELVLVGGQLAGGAPFDIQKLKSKVVVVYYWASWNQQTAGDFAKLKSLHGTYAAKGLEIVCVNVDDSPAAATSFLQKNPTPGIHLYEAGGLNSKLAKPYGIQVLPTLFLVGKDGKVKSRTVQISNLEDEVKKEL